MSQNKIHSHLEELEQILKSIEKEKRRIKTRRRAREGFANLRRSREQKAVASK